MRIKRFWLFFMVFFFQRVFCEQKPPALDLDKINSIEEVQSSSFETVEVSLTCLDEQIQRMHGEIEKMKHHIQHIKQQMIRQGIAAPFAPGDVGAGGLGYSVPSALRVTSQDQHLIGEQKTATPSDRAHEKTEQPIDQMEKACDTKDQDQE